ncbi:hypothetical protein [Ralstonia chuxiongensis]|uniref:DnaT DNA-binding domain-containing protein n=1 Tax=Ralstonia chuxiongensis TaxID=2957504 RepID=A0AA42BI94_9RALS|nr:hypothetical protein [Ralstonia chuxiongensis]MCP1173774.1 hypothetical protein [Ralstonia chuxiongensis]
MARIRTIKPEFFTSEDIVEMSPFARLLYVALWCEADREGRMTWKPKTFKLRYFPADAIDIDALCEEIIGRGLVELYGDGLAYIPKFLDHQHINPRESPSSLPPPDDASHTREPRVDHASGRDSDVQVGREGKESNKHASVDAMFEEFWTAYPKKVSKAAALKAYRKIKPSESLQAEILAAVSRAKTSVDWSKDDGQFIPYPASWLNARRWEDEAPSQGGAQGRFAGLK